MPWILRPTHLPRKESPATFNRSWVGGVAGVDILERKISLASFGNLTVIKSHNTQSNKNALYCVEIFYSIISCESVQHVSIPHGIIWDSY
jgi:hypothetical protein